MRLIIPIRTDCWRLIPIMLLVVVTACRTAQQLPSSASDHALENSLLWRISGHDAQTSYLFGNIHLISEDDYFFAPHMQSAFDSSEVLSLEFNLEDAMDMSNMFGLIEKIMMRGDTTLQDLLTVEEYQTVSDHFNQLGLPMFMMQRIKPMFLTILASEELFGSSDTSDTDVIMSYEIELSGMASERGMGQAGLESMDYQLGVFDIIPYRDQAQMLVESITQTDDSSTELDSMVQHYVAQDLERLHDMINSDPMTRKYRSVLLDQRNQNWIPVIRSQMAEAPTFFAVGAGHLAGDQGVIQLLREAGYQVIPIFGHGAN